MQKRRHLRTIKRLEIKFSIGGTGYTGITSNLSSEGIFVRTQKGLAPGTPLDMELYLPSGETIKLRGIVKRTIKTQIQRLKNGMGIGLIDIPQDYITFLKTLQ